MADERGRQGGGQQQDDPGGAGRTEAGPPFWEWAMAGVGMVLLLASLGYFSYLAVVREADIPAPAIEVTSVEEQGGRFLVRLRVSNRGRSTAAEVKVTGSLTRDGQVVEESETQFQYLPGESSRDGGLFFSRNPREFQLELLPRSYQKP